MTRKNSDWKFDPFLLSPSGKDYLWGGTRLEEEFGKELDLDPLAETWECSTHPDGPSIVANGIYQGKSLIEVVKQHPELLGEHSMALGELPILIKFIDAKQDLSLQVHPNDEYAKAYENGQLGKSEFWYVLDATKDAKLIYGFHHEVESENLRKSILDGTVEKYTQRIPVKKGDMFYIEAGTVHAIGAGTLIAEIQENSNLTYRMYDYNRTDKYGNKRELHVDKALAVANLTKVPEPGRPLHVLRYTQGCASEILCRCKYFQVERLLVNTERCRAMMRFQTDSLSFQVLLCIGGCGSLHFRETEALHFFKGDCIFIPANSVPIKIHGDAQFLKVSC